LAESIENEDRKRDDRKVAVEKQSEVVIIINIKNRYPEAFVMFFQSK